MRRTGSIIKLIAFSGIVFAIWTNVALAQIPYTPTSNYNVFYTIYDLTYINDGVLDTGTIWGPSTPDPYELTMTFSAPDIVDSVRIKGGQYNGNFNVPAEMKLYRGTSSGTLLTTIIPTSTMDNYSFSNSTADSVYTWVITPIGSYSGLLEIECYKNMAPPIADFSVSPISICVGGTVDFTDLSTFSPTSWSWSFPGSVQGTSTSQNPLGIQYNTTGTYDVTLTVTNAFGSDVETKTAYIYVGLVADLSAAPTLITSSGTVDFTDLSTCSPTSWFWSFPGATPTTSTGQNPTGILYSAPGSYDVTLTVTNAGSSDIITIIDYINVVTTGNNAIFSTGPAAGNDWYGTTPINLSDGFASAVILGNDTAFCLGDTLTLDAGNAGSTFLWQDGSTNQTFDVDTTGTYYVRVGDSTSCQVTDTINVTVNPGPAVSITGNNNICAGDSASLTASGGSSYLWNTGDSTATITVGPDSSTTYSVTVSDTVCLMSTIDSITVTVTSTTAPTNLNPQICEGDSLLAGGLYQTTTGTYYDSLTASGGCDSIVITQLTVNPFPIPVIAGNTSICIGDNTTLTASGGTGYVWSTGDTTQSITVNPLVDDTYSVTVSNACGSASDSLSVTVNMPPTAYAGEDVSIILSGDVQLSGSGGVVYSWSPSTGLSCTNCQNPVASPTETTTYYLTVTDNNGCTNLDEITIYVDITRYVFVANIFSPNGDGENDLLHVIGKGIKTLEIHIYNRWGEVVFSAMGGPSSGGETLILDGWDGNFRGKPLNSGVFVYYLKTVFLDDEEMSEKGNVTLIR